MVDTWLLQTGSVVIASAGVFGAAVYYILQIRHQGKLRQTDLVIKLSSEFKSKEFLEAFSNVYEAEFSDFDDFVKKYGKPFSNEKVPMSFHMMGNFFEQVGVLLKNKLVDPSLIDQLVPVSLVWKKMKPYAEGMRKEMHQPKLWEWFEYLYNEMSKLE